MKRVEVAPVGLEDRLVEPFRILKRALPMKPHGALDRLLDIERRHFLTWRLRH
jgi:hypothetical protein